MIGTFWPASDPGRALVNAIRHVAVFVMVGGLGICQVQLPKVSGYPLNWDRVGGCEVPSSANAFHMAPELDQDVVLTISNLSGVATSTFVPGEEYTVTMPSYFDLNTHAWVHSSAGDLTAGEVGEVAACGLAWFSPGIVPTEAIHEFVWTAPAAAGCVTLSAAQAGGPTDGYHINTAQVCSEGATAPLQSSILPDDSAISSSNSPRGGASLAAGAVASTAVAAWLL